MIEGRTDSEQPTKQMKTALPIQPFSRLFPLLALIGALMSVSVSADTGRPNPERGPTPVQLSIFLLDLDGIDSASQSFQANVYFEATWTDPRQANEQAGKTITRGLSEVWNPRLQILNQQRVWSSLPDVVDRARRDRHRGDVLGDRPNGGVWILSRSMDSPPMH
jgi:hypothetical protein